MTVYSILCIKQLHIHVGLCNFKMFKIELESLKSAECSLSLSSVAVKYTGLGE